MGNNNKKKFDFCEMISFQNEPIKVLVQMQEVIIIQWYKILKMVKKNFLDGNWITKKHPKMEGIIVSAIKKTENGI